MLRFTIAFLLLAFCLSIFDAGAQTYYPVTHISGTQTVGGVNTTVTASGVAGSFSNYCGAAPYRIGSSATVLDGYGKYTFTFATPITAFRIQIAGLNIQEVDSVFVNGIFYPIPAAGLSTFAGTCNQPIINNISGTLTGNIAPGGSSGEINVSASTINSVTVSANSNSGGSGNVFSFFIATTGIFATNNGPLCASNSNFSIPLQLNSTTISGASYLWTGPNGFTSTAQNPVIPAVTTANNGTYTVTATSGAVSVTTTTTVVVNPSPNALTTFLTNIVDPSSCTANDGSFTLNGLQPYITQVAYLKNGVLITVPVTVSSTGTVIITGLGPGIYKDSLFITAAGCTASGARSSFPITAPSPPLPTVTSPVNYCQGATATPLTATALAGYTLSWYTTATGGTATTAPTPSTSAIGSTTYYVSQTNNVCEGQRAAITVDVTPAPAAPVASSNTVSCSGGTLNFSASGAPAGGTYQWTGPNGFTSTLQNPVITNATSAASGTYTVVIKVGNCTSAATTLIIPPITTSPVITFVASTPSTNCSQSNGTITIATNPASQFYSFAYSRNTINAPAINYSNSFITGQVTFASLSAGTYTNIVAILNGCTSNALGPIVITGPPSLALPSVSVNNPVCIGSTIQLTTTATGTYQWSGPNGFTSTVQNPTLTATAAAAGSYQLIVTQNGCQSPAASINVIVNPVPLAPVASSNSPVCAGNVLTLSATTTSGNTYSWSGPNGFSSTSQNPSITNVTTAAAGSYSVTTTANGCISLAGSTTVVIYPKPVISSAAGANPTTCSGANGSITLNGLGAVSTYTITYSKNGGTPITLTLTSNTTGNAVIPNLTAGSYSGITVTSNGCASNAANTVTLIDPSAAAAPILTGNSPVCVGGTIALGTTATGSYNWTGPNGFTATVQNPTLPATPNAAGTYSLIITNNNCPSLPGTITIAINAAPSTPTVAYNSPLCAGDTLKLRVNAVTNASYSWSGPNSFTTTTQNPVIPAVTSAAAGTYSVTVTVTGCPVSATGNTVVVVNPIPVAPVPLNVTYCTGDSPSPLTATTATGNTLRWYTTATGGTASTTAPIPSTTNGNLTYYVSQVNASGCEGPRAALTVTITVIPGPIVTSPQNLCQFQVAVPLTATGDSIRWYSTPIGGTASLTAPIPVTVVPGTFNYYVTQKIGTCTSPRTPITVIVNPKPAPPTVTTPLRLCQYDSVALSADGVNTRWYLHPTGGGGQSPYVPPTGGTDDSTYYYATQTVNGCESDRSRLLVTVSYKPNGIISPTRAIVCQEEQDSFYYFGNARPDAVYNWTSPHPQTAEIAGAGTQGPYIVRFDSAGTYNVNVQVNNRGCLSEIATFPIIVRPRPALLFVAKGDACVDEIINVALSAVSPAIDSFNYSFPGGVIRYGAASGGPYGVVYSTPGTKIISNTAYFKGCPSRITNDTIMVHGLPDARFTVSSVSGASSYCTGDSLVVTAFETDSNAHFIWRPDNFFTSGNVYTAKGMLRKSGYITLKLTSRYGCVASDSMYVKTENCCGVFFPNAFSPNGDGKNDVFRPVTRGHHEVRTFRIINRWGQTVYESQDENRGWDGIYNGKPQDLGTYYYYIAYTCGDGGGDSPREQFEDKGEFLLMR